ncbi:MAG: DUF4351 domain-containing protein [Leptolyngbyaceae cyanobacterium CSU_1_4]|nr:DUF4351 domain-containing protein [Leptolyngbyaceae cyanobacterium CSU_1_4]
MKKLLSLSLHLEHYRQEEGRSLILRQLTRQVGDLSEGMRTRINTLSLEQLESLGETLLDFGGMADLEAWFKALM